MDMAYFCHALSFLEPLSKRFLMPLSVLKANEVPHILFLELLRYADLRQTIRWHRNIQNLLKSSLYQMFRALRRLYKKFPDIQI